MLNTGYEQATESRVDQGQGEADSVGDEIAIGKIPIDPQLVQHSQELCNAMIGAQGGTADPEIESLHFDSVQCVPSPTRGPQWNDTLDFVRIFSTINITCNQGLQQWGSNARTVAHKEKILATLQGNSRDNASSFMYACKNNVHGCKYSNGSRVEINDHERTCPIISESAFEVLAEKEVAKTFACTEEDCLKMFDNVGKRNRYVKDLHGWPKPCPKGCDIDPLPSRHAMIKHMETHSDFTSTKCRVPGCTSDTAFDRAKIYRTHVKKVHNIIGKDIDQYMPYTKTVKFEPTRCQVDNCNSQTVYKLPNKYKAHLRNGHDMEEDEVEFYAVAAGC